VNDLDRSLGTTKAKENGFEIQNLECNETVQVRNRQDNGLRMK
jgi:hypothetical protein